MEATDVNDWRPTGVANNYNRDRPKVGDVVAFKRRAWEVTHIADAEPTAEEQDRLNHYIAPRRDQMKPYTITLRRVHGAEYMRENSQQEAGFRCPVGAYNPFPVYVNGRVPLCSCHGHPWPCLEADQQAQAEREMAAAEKELRLMPGCCPACEEPVTSRQRSITFGGPNVRNPLAQGPTFHLRSKCWYSAAQYEELWVNAEPGRPRSLLTLYCEGTLIVHGDGSGECFGANGSDCPSVYAQHRCVTACYYQSHGCGRECSPVGHPGTHLVGRPSDPRAVTVVT